MTARSGPFSGPGFTSVIETHEASFLWQNMFYEQPAIALDNMVVSTAADAGNTPTSTLRAGLIMAKDANGLWTPYDADGLGTASYAQGVLGQTLNMLDYITAANANRQAVIYRAGGARVKAAGLVNLDYQARWQLENQGFHFDDGPSRKIGNVVTKTAAYQVTVADNGTTFNNAGDGDSLTFTLPAIEVGLWYRFVNLAGVAIVVASTEGDNIIAYHEADADSVAIDQTGEMIGQGITIESVYTAASTLKWIATYDDEHGTLVD